VLSYWNHCSINLRCYTDHPFGLAWLDLRPNPAWVDHPLVLDRSNHPFKLARPNHPLRSARLDHLPNGSTWPSKDRLIPTSDPLGSTFNLDLLDQIQLMLTRLTLAWTNSARHDPGCLFSTFGLAPLTSTIALYDSTRPSSLVDSTQPSSLYNSTFVSGVTMKWKWVEFHP